MPPASPVSCHRIDSSPGSFIWLAISCTRRWVRIGPSIGALVTKARVTRSSPPSASGPFSSESASATPRRPDHRGCPRSLPGCRSASCSACRTDLDHGRRLALLWVVPQPHDSGHGSRPSGGNPRRPDSPESRRPGQDHCLVTTGVLAALTRDTTRIPARQRHSQAPRTATSRCLAAAFLGSATLRKASSHPGHPDRRNHHQTPGSTA